MKGLKGYITVKDEQVHGKIVGEYIGASYSLHEERIAITIIIFYSNQGEFYTREAEDFTPTSL